MTAKMIAACAGNTGARGQKHPYLQAAGSLGYDSGTPQPSRRGQQLQNTVAGIGLLMSTAAQSRNTAQSCGFFDRAPVFGGSFGGPQGRRFNSSAVLPVDQLRSSCHPRLVSCVAVVLRAQLDPTMAKSLTSVHDDLRVSIHPRACSRYYGTAEQLVAEGLIPDGFKWPNKARRAAFEMGEFTHFLGRCRPDGIKGPMSIWTEGDYWCLQRSLIADEGKGGQAAQLYEKSMELAEIIRRNTPEWMREFNRAWEARKDAKYQAFRQQLLGEPKRGRGRPPKTTTQVTTQGATA